MTTALHRAIEHVQRLSSAELAELQAWINEHPAELKPPAGETPPTRIVQRPDFAARLRKGWGDAPSASENTVIALRKEERF